MRVTAIKVRFETKTTDKYDYVVNEVELDSNLADGDDPVKELQRLQIIAWKSLIRKNKEAE
jgi:hypothetical protein